MTNTLEQINARVEIKNQVVYLNSKDVGFFELQDESKVVGVLGSEKDSPRFIAADVPQAIMFILGHAFFGMEYFKNRDFH